MARFLIYDSLLCQEFTAPVIPSEPFFIVCCSTTSTGSWPNMSLALRRNKKASLRLSPLPIAEEELRPVPAKGWAEMIRKVYEVEPLLCPHCGGTMRLIAFLTDYAVVDKIINHLKLTFIAERPPPPFHLVYQELLMDSETGAEYFS